MPERRLQIPNEAGWRFETLEDICSLISRGTSPVYVERSATFAIGQRCVQDAGFDVFPARPHHQLSNANILRPELGDVLLNSTGAGTIGRSCVFDVDGDFMVDGHVTVLRAHRTKADPRWINALLRSPWGQRHLESHCYTGSTNQVELSRAELASTVIPLPPVNEQRRIAEILDTLDAQLRATRVKLDKIRATRQGLLARGVTDAIECAKGGLGFIQLGQVAEIMSGVTLGNEPVGGTSLELPYLRVANVQDGFIDTSEMKSVRVLRSEIGRYGLRAGDVLLTEGGDWDKLGRGAVWDGRISPCLYQNHLFRVRCDRSRMLPEYLSYYVSSPFGKAYFSGIAKQTTNLATINSKQLKAMPIPAPSLSEQRRFIRLIDAIERSIEAENADLAAARNMRHGIIDDLLTGRVRV